MINCGGIYSDVTLYLQMCTYPSMPEYEWGDGDTLDREHVRDILLQSPQFTFGG